MLLSSYSILGILEGIEGGKGWRYGRCSFGNHDAICGEKPISQGKGLALSSVEVSRHNVDLAFSSPGIKYWTEVNQVLEH